MMVAAPITTAEITMGRLRHWVWSTTTPARGGPAIQSCVVYKCSNALYSSQGVQMLNVCSVYYLWYILCTYVGVKYKLGWCLEGKYDLIFTDIKPCVWFITLNMKDYLTKWQREPLKRRKNRICMYAHLSTFLIYPYKHKYVVIRVLPLLGKHPVSSSSGGKHKIRLFYPKFECYFAGL